ncbi:hypothetical protein TrVE_jg1531 [Triparma verrucosa]|uniref:Uncharacterized protein n=1 Tax=Triparma verrucosa TaxID=1606542 RepID=A0A9W7C9H5_9STRA|nr:hypothetical protein TrVE_jg1531 [Triparma verrucosa]
MKFCLLVLLATVATTAAYNPHSPPSSRRTVLNKASALITSLTILTPTISSAGDIKQCKAKASNCLSTLNTGTKWTSKKSQSAAASDLEAVLKSYPQEGQNGIDGGGYTIVSGSLSGSDPEATVEYKSSGTGNMAKYFNGGKPFVDDLNVKVNANGEVEWSSSSRVGDSDFGVNAKRVAFIENGLREKGWKF